MENGRIFAAVLLCVCCWTCVVSGYDYVKYKDSSLPVDARVEDLLARMTVAEKVGQMAQIERSIASGSVMKKYFLGNLFSASRSTQISWPLIII